VAVYVTLESTKVVGDYTTLACCSKDTEEHADVQDSRWCMQWSRQSSSECLSLPMHSQQRTSPQRAPGFGSASCWFKSMMERVCVKRMTVVLQTIVMWLKSLTDMKMQMFLLSGIFPEGERYIYLFFSALPSTAIQLQGRWVDSGCPPQQQLLAVGAHGTFHTGLDCDVTCGSYCKL
jgi:hypothetical protein